MAARDDFKHLQVPLTIAAVAIALGAALAAGSLKWTEQARQEQLQAQAARVEAAGKLARAREEEQEIKHNLLQYRALADQGIVGEENRLDWIERIAAIKLSRKLYDIHYEIAEQKKLDDSGANASGPDIMISRMNLNLPLLHEGDLFHLLGDLRAGTRGYFQVRSCQLSREPPADRRALAPQLGANCELDFYTIRERVPTKVAGS
jgi:hypothetical protein